MVERRGALVRERGLLGQTADDKGTLLGTPNEEPQEYSSNVIEYKHPGRYISFIFLLYSWRSLFGAPIRTLNSNPRPSIYPLYTPY